MPIYEYRCASCGHEKEVLQKLSDPPLTECPACGKSALTKLVSAAGFHLKGSGWYATDFKSSGSKPKPTDGTKEAQDKSESKDKDAGKDKQEGTSKEKHTANDDAKAGKEPSPAMTANKAPLPVTNAGKADQ